MPITKSAAMAVGAMNSAMVNTVNMVTAFLISRLLCQGVKKF